MSYYLKLIKNNEKEFHLKNYEVFFQNNLNYIKRLFDEEREILMNKNQQELLPADFDFIELMFQISEYVFGIGILFEFISERFLINLIKFLVYFVDLYPSILTNVNIFFLMLSFSFKFILIGDTIADNSEMCR